jgi:hypothetical protein
MLMPVVWRIRVSELQPHQRRLLAAATIAVAVAVTAAAGQTWVSGISLSAMQIIVSLSGWRLGNPAFYNSPHIKGRHWGQIVMIGSALQISSWPVTVAIGVPFNRFWPEALFLTYLFGAVMYLSIRHHQRTRPQPASS